MRNDIYAVRFHVYPSYYGLLVGVPDEEMNSGFIGGAKDTAEKLFGSPVYVKEPEIKMTDDTTRPYPRLPSWTIISQLESQVDDIHYDGRTLTHVMFVDDIGTKSISEIVEDAAKELKPEWKQLSKLWAW